MKSIFLILLLITGVFLSTTVFAQSSTGAGSYINQPADPSAPMAPKGFSSPVKGDPSIDTTRNQVHSVPDQDDPNAPKSKKKRKFNFTSTTIPSTNGTNGSNTAPGGRD